ncbi:carbohydrate porin [Hymenobacter sp. DH14]|uniref:Carbohydrate porin n=1 Tax=Hymenobacter cyanobacteriorum TaxID=2926463 RepID=A0A9X1VH00_9BACT|nr:carbohydrate porin [Hymenobacter cyanobacteriorum]MCI1188488.1 carbohydrate porin [Hymenobacter cyanobacteriorum]
MRFAFFLLLAASPLAALAQVTPAGSTTPPTPPTAASAQEPLRRPVEEAHNWSLHFQQTFIDQWHNNLTTPYAGDYSLADRESAKLSFTSTFFIGRRLWKNAAVYFNPEVAGGSGLSSARGIAGFPNGETFRIGLADPVLYLARLYVRQVFAIGAETDVDVDDLNQVAGPTPRHYVALNLGKMSVADFFDQNSYSHDPRTQFMNWSLMSAGAWDYAANTRGYTVGGVLEYVTPDFSLRFGSTLLPTYANGPLLDYRYGKAHAETLELTKTYHLAKRQGTLRVLGFRNVAPMATYRSAILLAQLDGGRPDLETMRHDGHTKVGFSLNAEQEIAKNVGLFARVSYNDGQNETWAFTEIDHSASLGVVSTGARWNRPDDRLGAAVVVNGISPEHQAYLAAGGYGFIIGDGRLNYGLEKIGEVYYSIDLHRYHAAISPDYQFILNPAYNKDRSGPVHVVAVRLHVEF